VTHEGLPVIEVTVAGRPWDALIDTGFNGALELPVALRGRLNDEFDGRITSLLAGGQIVSEDAYLVDFPFGGETIRESATYAPGSEILIGTRLLRDYRLEIDFVGRTLVLERLRG
jgi:predicted aspartyl protease